MNNEELSRVLAVMEQAAFKAGSSLLSMQPKTRRLASRKDFLTDADNLADKIISEELARKFPNIFYSSEEKWRVICFWW